MHKWPKQSSLMKKPTINCPGYILLVLKALQDFTSIVFRGYLCGIFVHLQTHLIASNWFETFRTSLIHCLLMIQLSLSARWFTADMFLNLTCGYSNLPLSFIFLKFWKFANPHKITSNFAQMTETVFVHEKTYFELPRIHLCGFADSPRFHRYSFQWLSLWYLCSFGTSTCDIKLIWNFAHIAESLPVIDKTKFSQFMTHCGEVPRVDQWL